MVSTTKKCIWQANPLVREGANSFKFLFKKWSIWILLGLRVVRKHLKRFQNLPGRDCIQTAPNCSWLRVWIWKMQIPLDLSRFMDVFALNSLSVLKLLNCDFQKSCYFVRHMQKLLRHTEGDIQKTYIFLAFVWYIWIAIFGNLVISLDVWQKWASHGGDYSKIKQFP